MASPATESERAATRGLAARAIGIIVAPRETFEAVAAHPRWFGMLALTLVPMAVLTFLFLSTETGREALLEQQVSSIEAFGMTVTDEMYARLRAQLPAARYWAAGQFMLVWPLVLAIVAGVLFTLFSALLGGAATFRQVFSVTAHTTVISLLQQLFTLPLALARGSLGGVTNLAVLAPMLDETSFLGRLLGAIDVFWIWWTVVLAIGLSVLYRRRTRPILVGLLAVYGVIALAIAALMRGSAR
ncbi:MAG TPA: YIP1 family protein [Vicinamibacterales bacterium]|nr:YIP1 family protein [Vicinamibacterales bacterium]